MSKEEEAEVHTIEFERGESDPKYITLPAEGGTQTLTTGDTIINFYTGEVFFADGTEGHVSRSLQSLKKDNVRSISVNADKAFVIQLDDGGKHTVKTTEAYVAKRQKFQIATITVTETTKIRVVASTDPDATIDMPKAVAEGGTLKGSKFNEAVSAATDIFSTALIPTHPATLFRIYACFDTSGVLSVRRTYGGTTVSEKLNAGADLSADCAYAFDISVLEDQSINLRYSVAATAAALIVSEVV
jgi:hypothetical protein